MSISLINHLLGGLTGNNNVSASTKPQTSSSGLSSLFSANSGSGTLGGVLSPVMNVASGLLGGIKSVSNGGSTTVPMTNTALSTFNRNGGGVNTRPTTTGLNYYSFQPALQNLGFSYLTQPSLNTGFSRNNQFNTGYYPAYNMAGFYPAQSQFTVTQPTTVTTSTPNTGSGLVGVGTSMAEGNVGMLGVSGLLGGALAAVGTAAGGLAQGAHHLAENTISFTGAGSLFGPLVDDPIIHPLLWDPLSTITGVDVSKHPAGVADVSDPLNVRTNISNTSTSSANTSSLGGLLNGFMNII
jgi:hypothetical protein